MKKKLDSRNFYAVPCETKEKAELLMGQFHAAIKEIGYLTRNDIRATLGYPSVPYFSNLGWKNLDDMYVLDGMYHGELCYKIIMPLPEKLNIKEDIKNEK